MSFKNKFNVASIKTLYCDPQISFNGLNSNVAKTITSPVYSSWVKVSATEAGLGNTGLQEVKIYGNYLFSLVKINPIMIF